MIMFNYLPKEQISIKIKTLTTYIYFKTCYNSQQSENVLAYMQTKRNNYIPLPIMGRTGVKKICPQHLVKGHKK